MGLLFSVGTLNQNGRAFLSPNQRPLLSTKRFADF